MPTLFHEQVNKLKLPESTQIPQLNTEVHSLSLRAVVEWTEDLTHWDRIKRLDTLHIWKEEVIRERFEYNHKQGLSLAFLRIYKLQAPFEFPDSPRYGGCRSWVTLPDTSLTTVATPVLNDTAHQMAQDAVRLALR